MRSSPLPALVLLCLAGPLCAGPLFDDYLNYVRPGPGTAPGDAAAAATAARPIGQSVVLPARTAEVYRIGIRPLYDTWDAGESVTMTVYDSPARRTRLAAATIEEAASRVQAVHNTKDRVLFFHFRVPTTGRRTLYFDLSVKGGDGSVAFQAFRKDAYPAGQSTGTSPEIRDLAFVCHIKPEADREANLRAFFTERLDIERPELTAIRDAVALRDWEKAIAETVRHFHGRRDVWDEWKEVMTVTPRADADTGLADLLLKNRLRHVETKQALTWRVGSYWMPEYRTERAQPNHAVEPMLYLWHVDRTLASAYTDTGRTEYARKAIDLRMQFILDNPSPKTSGLPWYFELWNDRTAAGRAPGHGTLAYARLYHFDGWTNDEKLVFFAFLEDNAAWTYQAQTGANWGAEAARACYEFGLKFPEWKRSAEFVRWGTRRLAEIVLQDVRGDGTSTEAAIKYHAMVARRLAGMLRDHVEGRLQLEPAVLADVKATVERMYDVMAHTLQPHGYVVMAGDSWYENYSEELAKVERLVNRPDFVWIGTQGKEGQLPQPASKVFPAGGYFIMRSDFGGPGIAYTDSRQLFLHNGGWFGSHGHFDLTSINLYAYGRPLVIDPGQYDYNPPPGIDRYWQSNIHAMLVADGTDVKREAGPSEWASNAVMDWYDGRHFGYKHLKGVQEVRRRIVFVKPDYFLFDDSAQCGETRRWAQVWNLTDPNARIDSAQGVIATTFRDGGNILILNQDPSRFAVETVKGITASKEHIPETRIVRLTCRTSNPRFQTLLYPYKGDKTPKVEWRCLAADGKRSNDLTYAAEVRTAAGRDWVAFGRVGQPASFRAPSAQVDAECVLVRMQPQGDVRAFAWTRGRRLSYGGKVLARADAPVHAIGVHYEQASLWLEAPEPETTLAVAANSARTFILNGKPVTSPVVKEGFFLPFANEPTAIIADDLDRFERLTRTDEWSRQAEPAAWAGGCTVHETDPGRQESGHYLLDVPAAARYCVAVHIPEVSHQPSDRVEYALPAGGQPPPVAGPIVDVRNLQTAVVVTVNQQRGPGWVELGEYSLNRGRLRILSRNVTQTDGLYFVADAVRIVPAKRGAP